MISLNTGSTDTRQGKIIYHALLIGVSPLIPVVFLDEIIVGFFWRRMVADLAKTYDIILTKAQIVELVNLNGPGCRSGCTAALTYLIKEIFREILFWLEVRRGIDLATRAYYSGYLVNILFQLENFDPRYVPQYSQAIVYATQGINRNIIKNVFINALDSSKEKVRLARTQLVSMRKRFREKLKKNHKSLVSRLGSMFSKSSIPVKETSDNDEEINLEFDKEEYIIRSSLNGLINNIGEGIRGLPAEHLDNLRKRLINGLIIQGLEVKLKDIDVEPYAP